MKCVKNEGNSSIACNYSTHLPMSIYLFSVGNGYATDHMFKLNLEINKNLFSTYMLFTFNVGHARLYYVNKRLINNMSRLNLIPKLSMHEFEKMCMLLSR